MSRFRKYSLVNKLVDSEDGFALSAILVVLGVMTVIITLGVVLVPLTQTETTSTSRETAATQSLYIAEAGLNDYVWHLNRMGAEYFHTTTHPAQGSGNWLSYENGEYNLDITEDTATASFKIVSTGRVNMNGITTTRKVEAKLAAKSFTQYIWFSNYERVESSGERIYFASGDVMRGPLHTNDNVNIWSDDNTKKPKFMQHVSTSKTVYYGKGLADFVEVTSPEENADKIELPSTNSSLMNWANPAYNDGSNYQYTGATRITLKTNGKMDIYNGTAGNTGITGTDISIPKSGVIYVNGLASPKGANYDKLNGDVFVSGQLNGRLTIAAKNNIYITADLTYFHGEAAFADPNSDMLGLIADNYVYILHHWSNTGTPPQGAYPYDAKHVAPNDIHINAAILTVNHSYGFEDYGDYGDDKKGTIYLKGSIAQNYRGAVGYIGSTGYLKDYDYDPRMKYRQPPHYISPANSGFEIISWKQIN